MYVEPWIFWLILAPVAAISALYIGYLAMILLGLLSLTIGLVFSLAHAWITTAVPTYSGRTATWILRPLVVPFRHVGPWLDYAVVAGVALALSIGGILWLSA